MMNRKNSGANPVCSSGPLALSVFGNVVRGRLTLEHGVGPDRCRPRKPQVTLPLWTDLRGGATIRRWHLRGGPWAAPPRGFRRLPSPAALRGVRCTSLFVRREKRRQMAKRRKKRSRSKPRPVAESPVLTRRAATTTIAAAAVSIATDVKEWLPEGKVVNTGPIDVSLGLEIEMRAAIDTAVGGEHQVGGGVEISAAIDGGGDVVASLSVT